MYPADGKKPRYLCPAWELRSQLQAELGSSLFNFWGPNTSIRCSQWIAEAAKWVEQHYSPTLSLVYAHLDSCLQRFGPIRTKLQGIYKEMRVCGDLIDYYENRGAQVVILSEYGGHISVQNRPSKSDATVKRLTERTRRTGGELLDAGASTAFAVADHQVAHGMLTIRYTFPRYALCWKQLRVLPRS